MPADPGTGNRAAMATAARIAGMAFIEAAVPALQTLFRVAGIAAIGKEARRFAAAPYGSNRSLVSIRMPRSRTVSKCAA